MDHAEPGFNINTKWYGDTSLSICTVNRDLIIVSVSDSCPLLGLSKSPGLFENGDRGTKALQWDTRLCLHQNSVVVIYWFKKERERARERERDDLYTVLIKRNSGQDAGQSQRKAG